MTISFLDTYYKVLLRAFCQLTREGSILAAYMFRKFYNYSSVQRYEFHFFHEVEMKQ